MTWLVTRISEGLYPANFARHSTQRIRLFTERLGDELGCRLGNPECCATEERKVA
jgi:hypothetical protein